VRDLRSQHCWFVAAGVVVVHGCEGYILVVVADVVVVDIDVVLETDVVSGVRLVVSQTVC